MNDDVRLVVLAKLPIAGFAKTRLIPALGTQGAAQLAQRMLQHTLQQVEKTNATHLELCVTPHLNQSTINNLYLPPRILVTEQGDGDLGQRLTRVAQRVIAAGQSIIIIGTDCPELDSMLLQQAIDALKNTDAVMIPATDGGYVLLGLNRFDASIFANIAWSTATVAEDTQYAIEQLSWRLTRLPACHDIDEPHDLVWLPEDWQVYLHPSSHITTELSYDVKHG